MNDTYKTDGVDIAGGDDLSKQAAEVCRATFENCRYVTVNDWSEHFRGPRTFQFRRPPSGYELMSAPDGIGTKVTLIDAARSYAYGAADVVAMCADDIVRWGGVPLIFTSVLDLASVGESGSPARRAACALYDGLGAVAKRGRFVVINGETAELGACVSSENPDAQLPFNWAGVMLGAIDTKRMITGIGMRAGQIVIALREHGFRSNGISSVRAALRKRFGEYWGMADNPDTRAAIKEAASPSTLYAPLIATANGWYKRTRQPLIPMHAVAHISGGGIVGKFAEDLLFSQGLSAELTDLFEPPPIMRACREWRDMSETEAYRVWNGGQGMLVVLDADKGEQFIELAADFGIEAKVCGEITDQRRGVHLRIQSQYGETAAPIYYHPA